jgi:hypothetical protein
MRSLHLFFAVLLTGPMKAAPRASTLTRTVGTAHIVANLAQARMGVGKQLTRRSV